MNNSLFGFASGVLGSGLLGFPGTQPYGISDIIALTPKVWLDASRLTGYVDGDAVGSWTDMSGNGYTPSSTSTARPLYKTGILSGKPVLRFDGADDYLQYTGGIVSGGAQPITVMAVCMATSFAGYPEIFTVGNTHSASVDGYQTLLNADGAHYVGNMGSNNERIAVAGGLPSTSTFYLFTFEILGAAFSANNPRFFRNNVQFASGRGSGAGTPSINPVKFRIGSSLQPGQYWPGDMAEVIVFNSILTPSQLTLTSQYLMQKYGLS